MKFMQKRTKSNGKSRQKDVLIAEMRQKLDLSQAVFAAILGVPRTLLTMAESKERQLPARAGELVTKMYAQFMELETGIQANYRSLETRLILNDLYKSEIPAMKAREKECRLKITRLSEELQENEAAGKRCRKFHYRLYHVPEANRREGGKGCCNRDAAKRVEPF
jgi:DNA-binding XRE family transcriptional regulator